MPASSTTSTAPIDSWREAMEAYRRAWVMSVAPLWPWVRPLGEPPANGGGNGHPAAFCTHAPGKTIAELAVGDSASLTRAISQADIDDFARISGDDNPAHVDAEWARLSPLGGRVAHGMLTAGLVSAVLGTQLPGPGAIYMSQSLKWLAPVRPGDVLTATVTVTEIIAEKGRAVLDTVVTRDGQSVLVGEALVKPARD